MSPVLVWGQCQRNDKHCRISVIILFGIIHCRINVGHVLKNATRACSLLLSKTPSLCKIYGKASKPVEILVNVEEIFDNPRYCVCVQRFHARKFSTNCFLHWFCKIHGCVFMIRIADLRHRIPCENGEARNVKQKTARENNVYNCNLSIKKYRFPCECFRQIAGTTWHSSLKRMVKRYFIINLIPLCYMFYTL